MDWQSYFPRHILARGYDYYESGNVRNVLITEDRISAVVMGTEQYQVQIDRDGEEIDPDMYCSCPYAEGGENCKHMAAVLFEVEDSLWPDEDLVPNEETQIQENLSGKKQSLSELVWQADENTVRGFLASILSDNERLALQFESLLRPAVSAEDVKRYKKVLDRCLAAYGDRYGFIDWREADDFCREISMFLADHVGTMMDNEAYSAAFDLAAYAFLQAAEQEMDDSSGCLGDLAEEISTIWYELYEAGDEKDRAYMFEWCEGHLDGSVVDYMEEYIEAFFHNCFEEEEYLKRKLSFVDKNLSGYNSDKTPMLDYTLSHLVRSRIDLMQALDFDSTALEEFAGQYWSVPEVRKWMAAEYEKKGQTDEAIRVYEQSLKLDHDLPGLTREYATKLKELYKANGRNDDYLSMLWDLELEYQPGNIDVFRELKSCYTTDDWVMQREKIYDSLPQYANRAALFFEEGLYDRLLTCCLSSPGISGLRDYKTELLELYPAEVLDRYVDTVEGMAKRTGTRAHYQELVAFLRQIRQMPGGKAQVAEIVDEWREQYRNRPAMMDELRKL